RCYISLLPVNRNAETTFIGGGIDWETHILRSCPCSVVDAPAKEKVCTTHARMPIAGEVKGVVVYMQKRCSFVTCRIDIRTEVDRLLPIAVFKFCHVNIITTITTRLIACKIELPVIC